MFFAGHMALAYVINRALGNRSAGIRKITANASPVFLFIAAIIPDLDFVFAGYIQHHTITHSITFWSAVYLPLFVIWRSKMLPYFVATLSHLLGDLILGNPPILYGIVDTRYGLFYEEAISALGNDWFVFVRSCLDLAVVGLFIAMRLKLRHVQPIFVSERDAFVGLPIRGIMIICILIATGIQDKLLSLRQPHDWPVFLAGYAILAISHVIVIMVIIREAQIFSRTNRSEQVAN